jgi:primosomal protein N' (replication factor Y)
MPIAKVEPLLTTRNVSGPFDYRLPEAMGGVEVGSVLVVPFGRRRVVGVVVGLADRSNLPQDRLAEPLEALEAGVPPELVALGRWVGEEYCSTTARGLGLVLPPGVGTGAEARRVRPLVELEVEATEKGLEAITAGDRLGLRQRAVLRALTAGPKLARQLAASAGSDRATLRRLEARGLVETREVERRRRHSSPGVGAVRESVELTPDQGAVLGTLAKALPRRGGQDRGLSGSGARSPRPGPRRDRARAGDRAHPADDGPLPPPLR